MKLPSTRRKEYTEAGIKRVPCAKCGQPSAHQWRICSTSQWTAVCKTCDEEINRMVAEWAFGKNSGKDIVKRYVVETASDL